MPTGGDGVSPFRQPAADGLRQGAGTLLLYFAAVRASSRPPRLASTGTASSRRNGASGSRRPSAPSPRATWTIAAGAEAVTQAKLDLHALLVPRPGQRSRASAILRELAVAPEPLSAQQLASLLDASQRPRVADLRALLRANDALFGQARRGGYELGRRYLLPDVA